MTKGKWRSNRTVNRATKGFDYIQCHLNLPELGNDGELEFNTKSLARAGRNYVLLADESLETAEWDEYDNYVHTPVDFSGTLVFYQSWPEGYLGIRSVEFRLQMARGKLVSPIEIAKIAICKDA